MPDWFYAPRDWLADRTNARLRGAIAFWLLAGMLVLTILTYPARESVAVLWAFSILALILALLAVLFAETPVEIEDESL